MVSQIYIQNRNNKASALIDSGACCSLISSELTCLSKKIEPDFKHLITAANDKIESLGEINLKFIISDYNITWTFVIVPKLAFDIILGRDFLSYDEAKIDFSSQTILSLNDSIKNCMSNINEDENNIFDQLMKKNSDLFAKRFGLTGLTNKVLHYKKTKSEKPIKQKPYGI